MPTADELVIDQLFASDGGQILCEGTVDNRNEYNPGSELDPFGRWATTSTGTTFYDFDNNGHWDAAGRPGGTEGFHFDTESHQWVVNDPDGRWYPYQGCATPGGIW